MITFIVGSLVVLVTSFLAGMCIGISWAAHELRKENSPIDDEP